MPSPSSSGGWLSVVFMACPPLPYRSVDCLFGLARVLPRYLLRPAALAFGNRPQASSSPGA